MCSVWVIHATVVRAVWNEGVESRFREDDGKGNRFCDKDGLEEGFFFVRECLKGEVDQEVIYLEYNFLNLYIHGYQSRSSMPW